MFVAVPAVVITWSVYAAICAWDSRQEALESDQTWRAQMVRLESSRKRHVREQAEPVAPAAPAPQASEAPVPEEYPDGMVGTSGALLGAATVGSATDTPPAKPPACEPAAPPKPGTSSGQERVELRQQLRELLGEHHVMLEEIRFCSPHVMGQEQVRTVKLKLVGKRDALKKALVALKTAPQMDQLSEPKVESTKRGEMHVIVTATLKS